MAMMQSPGGPVPDIARMPRGGPDASWLDRLLETGRAEYLDRDDVDADVKRRVISVLDRVGEVFKEHERNARLVLEEVADVADPRILELGSGHGGLSRVVLEQHPTARVTVTDINPASVARIADGDLGNHRRATVAVTDATDIDAPDRSYALAVMAMTFHHLPPPLAARVIAEGTRVADKMLIVDLARPPSLLHIVRLATMLPFAPLHPFVHDGIISSMRCYSRSALRALAAHGAPGIHARFVSPLLGPEAVVFERQSVASSR